jgi:hypothetical protein
VKLSGELRQEVPIEGHHYTCSSCGQQWHITTWGGEGSDILVLTIKTTNTLNINQWSVVIYVGFTSWQLHVSVHVLDHLQAVLLNTSHVFNLGCLHRVWDQGEGGFRLRNVNIVGFTIWYMFPSYDHLQAEIYLLELTLLTSVQYSYWVRLKSATEEPIVVQLFKTITKRCSSETIDPDSCSGSRKLKSRSRDPQCYRYSSWFSTVSPSE